jgi:hypothetical protein
MSRFGNVHSAKTLLRRVNACLIPLACATEPAREGIECSDTPDQTVYGARLQDLRVQSSSYGSVIPVLYGKGRLASNIIWMRGFDEEVHTETQTVGGGGKGGSGGGGQTTTNVTITIIATWPWGVRRTDPGGAACLRGRERLRSRACG